jgi:predicted HTH transcriptional regulator
MTMGNFFSKPLTQVDASDILDLIGVPEGQVFEIKSKLPADKKIHDPWYDEPESGKPRNGPGDSAKHDIFKEVVAFANSEGGWLVLGLTETSDHPKRVKGVDPLPDCHELADRFQRAAYDWIDPPLPSLQCRGIEIGDIHRKGVIAFRVPRSLDAPHRVNKKDRQAYKRVSDESKPMKMREIQGITLDIVRGQERIEK